MGLLRVCNLGLSLVKGKYVVYLDDDVIFCEEWLELILDSFIMVKLFLVCVGGFIYGLWEIFKLDWIDKIMEDFFIVFDYGL